MDIQKLARAKREYLDGRGSIREIAHRNGLGELNLQKYAFRNGWTEERSAVLVLKPTNDFQTIIAIWRSHCTEMVEECESLVRDVVKNCPRNNPKAALNCVRAMNLVTETWREVAGIPKVAPIKTGDKKEKSIPAETEPIESQTTDNQSDKQ